MKDHCSLLYSNNLFAPFHGRRYLDTDGRGHSRSVGIGAGIGEIITDTDTKPIPAVSADTRYPIRVSVSA